MIKIEVWPLLGIPETGYMHLPNSGEVERNPDGSFTIDVRDAAAALNIGYLPKPVFAAGG